MSRQLLTIYGTEFDELDEEQAKLGAPKKPTAIQDQVATDEQGRRRFHGAFTGGFSAGYFMSVGSKEGWQPKEFRSSRDERGTYNQLKPEDIMDKEDLGEFGIGARRIRQTDTFSREEGKRRLAWEHDKTTTSSLAQTLEGMIKPAKTSIGVRMLRAMGWKEGRGVGLATIKQTKTRGGTSTEADFDREQAAKVAPGYDLSLEDELVVQLTPLIGTQGLGYTGLKPTNVLDEKWGKLEAALKAEALHKKGRGIRGQAFGVGAFEAEDESVYTQFDMSQYDFALDGPGGSAEPKTISVDFSFEEMPKRMKPRTFYNAPRLPDHWKPNHKSIPIDVSKLPETIQKAMRDLTVEQRARLLGEDRIAQVKETQRTGSKKEAQKRSRWDIKAEQMEQERKSDPNRVEFPDEPMKQRRFKEFLSYVRRGLAYLKPTDLTVWEWESEKKDFEAKLTIEERAMLPEVRSRSEPLARSNLALPIKELMSNKFTKETGSSGHIGRKDEDKLAAVKMGMFGDITRSTYEWYPDNVIAKRFNVPNPYPGATFTGCPHLQKTTKTETLVNLGLPNTAAELVIKRHEPIQQPLESEEVDDEGEEEEVTVPEHKPPVSIFDAIFGDVHESEEESSDEDEEKKEWKAPSSDSDDSSEENKTDETKSSEAGPSKPPEKVITVMDLFNDEAYGPTPPPANAEQQGLSGFSVLRYLQDELKDRKKKKKEEKSRKHSKDRKRSKKSKREKKSKKDKREKKSKKEKKHRHKKSTPVVSSDSSESSDDSDVIPLS